MSILSWDDAEDETSVPKDLLTDPVKLNEVVAGAAAI